MAVDHSTAYNITHLAHVVIDTAASHELKDDAEVGLAGAGSNELDYVLVPYFPHDCHFLQTTPNNDFDVVPCFARVVSLCNSCSAGTHTSEVGTTSLLPHAVKDHST